MRLFKGNVEKPFVTTHILDLKTSLYTTDLPMLKDRQEVSRLQLRTRKVSNKVFLDCRAQSSLVMS